MRQKDSLSVHVGEENKQKLTVVLTLWFSGSFVYFFLIQNDYTKCHSVSMVKISL